MNFRGGPAQLIDYKDDVSRLGKVAPAQVGFVRGDHADQLTHAVQLPVPQQLADIRLQGTLADRAAVPWWRK